MKDEPWHSQIRFVVPYDPAGLHRLWASRGAANSGHGEFAGVTESFLDKSFQIRFEVAPLLLSNWKRYLFRLLSEAFPKHSENDHLPIYHVLSRCRKGPAPTPRELILYVNQVGAIHRQWGHQLPLDHVAYYAYLRRENPGTDIYDGLLKAAFPKQEELSVFTSIAEVRPNLAGLFFNVPADEGMQLVLGGPIFDALSNNDVPELQKLLERHGDAFWNVLGQVALNRLIGANASDLGNVALCLYQSHILDGQDTNQARTVRRKLGEASGGVTTWTPLEPPLLDGISAICSVAEDPSVSTAVVAALRSNLKAKEDLLTVDTAIPFVDGLVKILDVASTAAQESTLSAPFSLPVDDHTWIALSPRLTAESISRWYTHIQPKAGFGAVANAFAADAIAGSWTNEHTTALQLTVLVST